MLRMKWYLMRRTGASLSAPNLGGGACVRSSMISTQMQLVSTVGVLSWWAEGTTCFCRMVLTTWRASVYEVRDE